MHHIVTDHVAQERVLEEVAAHMAGRSGQLAEPLEYREYVGQALAAMRERAAVEYFRAQLGHIDEPTEPFGLLDVRGAGIQIVQAQRELEPDLSERIRRETRRLGMSAAALFHAAWALVAARTSGRDEVVFGSVLSGRLQGNAGAQRRLGMFINTLPLRVQLRDHGVEEIVRQTHRDLVQLLKYEQAALAEAQRCSGIEDAVPLFTSLFNYRHTSAALEQEQERALAGISILGSHERTNYPVTLSVDDLGTAFVLTAQTDPRVEPHRVVSYMHIAVRGVLEALEIAPDRLMLALPILPEPERRQVLVGFNATHVAYPQDKLLQELFEEQVQRTPQAPAVVYEQEQLSYQELRRRANQVAVWLGKHGVQAGEAVAILLPRSLDMVVAHLAVLKSGCAYVPIAPQFPPARQAFK